MHTAINSIEGIFTALKNSITALCLSRTSSQSSVSTGTVPELRIAMGSRSPLVEGRYHVTAWNRFYPVSIFSSKKIWQEKAKLFSPSPYTGLFEMIVGVLTTATSFSRCKPMLFLCMGLRQGSGLCSSSRTYPGTEGTNQNRHWNHLRWHATNSLERTRLSCWCL